MSKYPIVLFLIFIKFCSVFCSIKYGSNSKNLAVEGTEGEYELLKSNDQIKTSFADNPTLRDIYLKNLPKNLNACQISAVNLTQIIVEASKCQELYPFTDFDDLCDDLEDIIECNQRPVFKLINQCINAMLSDNKPKLISRSILEVVGQAAIKFKELICKMDRTKLKELINYSSIPAATWKKCEGQILVLRLDKSKISPDFKKILACSAAYYIQINNGDLEEFSVCGLVTKLDFDFFKLCLGENFALCGETQITDFMIKIFKDSDVISFIDDVLCTIQRMLKPLIPSIHSKNGKVKNSVKAEEL